MFATRLRSAHGSSLLRFQTRPSSSSPSSSLPVSIFTPANSYAQSSSHFSTTNTLSNGKESQQRKGASDTYLGQKKPSWSSTLLLPQTTFPMKLKDPVRAEMRVREKVTKDLYNTQREKNEGPVFVLHDGPPYANGNLHMGHALNKLLKDFINRYKASRGYRVNYIPGWDCHGLPIEQKALQIIGKSHLDMTPTMVRAEARKTALEAIEVQKSEFRQLGIMADWDGEGSTYRTLDHDFEIRQLRLLQKMRERGLLQHRKRPTYYSPSSRTALAEAELSYQDDFRSRSVYVYFKVPESGMSPALSHVWKSALREGEKIELGLAIWTTTAWTLPANMAVAVGEDIEYCLVLLSEHDRQGEPQRAMIVAEARLEELKKQLGELEVMGTISGKELVGTTYEHLFWNERFQRPQIIPSRHVTTATGTGLVHSAPAHGQEDYEVYRAIFKGQEDGEEDYRCPVDDAGNLTKDLRDWAANPVLADRLIGKNVLGDDAVSEMIKILGEEGILLAEEQVEHRYPCDWKTNKAVIIRATPQWFADVEEVKQPALEAMEKVEFKPEQSRRRLESFVLGRSEWCISRQRSWGVPIPALYDVETGEPILTTETLDHIIPILAEKGTDHWWSPEVDEFVPESLKQQRPGKSFRKGTDTMDVWFDSGSSWTLIKELALRDTDNQPIADIYLEGSDQHRGWFQSSLLTSLCSGEAGKPGLAPYRCLITHGMVLDQEGKKMSKSLGNGIFPTKVINGGKDRKKEPAYGTDILRLWASSVEYTRDVNLGTTALTHASENMRRIRNLVKYLLGNISRSGSKTLRPEDAQLSLVDKYVLHETSLMEKLAIEEYEKYNFSKVIQAVNLLNTNTISSIYVETIKDALYCDAEDSDRRQAIVATLSHVLQRLIRVLSPILPHLSEEVSEQITGDTSVSSAEYPLWKDDATNWVNKQVGDDMKPLLALRQNVMQLVEQGRASQYLKSAPEASLHIKTRNKMLLDSLANNSNILPALMTTANVSIEPVEKAEWAIEGKFEYEGDTLATLVLTPAKGHKCPRCWNHIALREDSLCRRCSEVTR